MNRANFSNKACSNGISMHDGALMRFTINFPRKNRIPFSAIFHRDIKFFDKYVEHFFFFCFMR